MDYEFWDNCWQRPSQPFHVESAHPLLSKYLHLFKKDRRVLLPLSGKSLDPIFLAENGLFSTSIEFNPTAVESFIADTQLKPIEKQTNKFEHFDFGKFEIWLADFFNLSSKVIGKFSQVFDRAALVALPDDLRNRYTQHLISLLESDAVIYMVTMDYKTAEMDGPPFYINLKALQEYFPNSSIKELDRVSLLNNHPRWKELELSYLDEVLYQIVLNHE